MTLTPSRSAISFTLVLLSACAPTTEPFGRWQCDLLAAEPSPRVREDLVSSVLQLQLEPSGACRITGRAVQSPNASSAQRCESTLTFSGTFTLSSNQGRESITFGRGNLEYRIVNCLDPSGNRSGMFSNAESPFGTAAVNYTLRGGALVLSSWTFTRI